MTYLHRFARQTVHPLLLSLTLTHCKAVAVRDHSELASTPGAQGDAARGIHFNLATYARARPELSPLAALAVPGDSCLKLGDGRHFLVQTNATADGEAAPGDPPTFQAMLWINGTVFSRALTTADHLVEISAQATSVPIGITGIVRYKGQEKFHGPVLTRWQQSFTRSLDSEAVLPSPIPGLGVTFGANLGGEFGATIEPTVSSQSPTMTVAFTPHVALSAEASSGVQAGPFADAEAFGSVTVIEASMAHFVALGYHKSVGIAAGSIGIEDGDMTWLKGTLGLRAHAKVSANNALPAGIDAALWRKASAVVNQPWEHILWAPPPVRITTLPSFSQFMERFLDPPKQQSECLSRVRAFQPEVAAATSYIDKALSQAGPGGGPSSDVAKAGAATKANYQKILTVIQSECVAL